MNKLFGLTKNESNDLFASAIEILPDCLYFVTLKKNFQPVSTCSSYYFSTDEKLIYESFYNDFGPLNVCMLYRYCCILNKKLRAKQNQNKNIIHYTTANQAKRLNAACLMGSYAVIYLNKSPEEIVKLLSPKDSPTYARYCDASYISSDFKISLFDCVSAVHKALSCGFINFYDFNAAEYEFYEKVENGDLNWIVPQKFIAFCGPHQKSKVLPNGYPCHAPQAYFDYFHKHNITTIIRLNAKVYQASCFEKEGFHHKDLFFVDGSTPSDLILKKFLTICETTKGAIAVHCKAGLGRTGTLIGAYIMKHYKFSALEAIAWLRLCRPGSVIGQQQQWMEEKQVWLWSEGERMRTSTHDNISKHEYGIYSNSIKNSYLSASIEMEEQLTTATPVKILQKVDSMRSDDPNLISNHSFHNKSVEEPVVRSFRNCSVCSMIETKNSSGTKEYQNHLANLRRRKNIRASTYMSNLVNTNSSVTNIANNKSQSISTTKANFDCKSKSGVTSKKPCAVIQQEVNALSLKATYSKSKNYVTQGDKLNQIKALRRQTRARSQQFWKCNASTSNNNSSLFEQDNIKERDNTSKSYVKSQQHNFINNNGSTLNNVSQLANKRTPSSESNRRSNDRSIKAVHTRFVKR